MHYARVFAGVNAITFDLQRNHLMQRSVKNPLAQSMIRGNMQQALAHTLDSYAEIWQGHSTVVAASEQRPA